MVLHDELEIGQCHGDEGGDNDQDDEHDEENAVNGIDLVAPDTGKDVIKLDVDG